MNGNVYKSLCKKSPHKAHSLLFGEYSSYVFTVVHNRLRSCAGREDIEECVSDVFADVFRALDGGGGIDGDLTAYIGAIAKRRAIDRYRKLHAVKTRSVSLLSDEPHDIADDTDIAKRAEDDELCRALWNEVAALGEPDTTIIIQKYYFGKTSSQIASALSMTPTNVRSRCARAIKKLREALQKSGFDS